MLWTLLGCGGDAAVPVAGAPAGGHDAAAVATALQGPSRTPEGTVVVVGLDGLDPEELRALLPDLPAFQRVAGEGFVTTYRVPTRPIWSPVVWTSVSSGYPQEVHGVTHWAQPQGGLYTADDVLVKRLWDVAGEAGWEVSVVGWPITEPAKPVRGVLVSGTFAPGLNASLPIPDDFAYPAAVQARAREWMQPNGWLKDPVLDEQMRALTWSRHPINSDEYFVRAWEALFDPKTQALSMLYLRGADQLGHIVERNATQPVLDREGRKIPGIGPRWVRDYYRYLDAALARVMARMDPTRDTLVALSDHGFQLDGESADEARHRDPALLMGWGRRAMAGAAAGEADDMYDVAATLYALNGLPLARDFAGAPIAGLFDYPEAADPVATYVVDPRGKPDTAHPKAAAKAPSPAEQAATEQLEALGYLDAHGRPAQAPHPPPPPGHAGASATTPNPHPKGPPNPKAASQGQNTGIGAPEEGSR